MRNLHCVMKKIILFVMMILFSNFLFAEIELEFDESTLFSVYSNTDKKIMIYDSVSEIFDKLGEPLKTEEKESVYGEDYNTITLYYEGLEINYWKAFSKVRSIQVLNNNFGISNVNIKIGETTIAEILEYYQNVDVSDYVVYDSENGNKNLKITFKTYDKKYMSEKANSFDYFSIVYEFDYLSKICIGVFLIQDAA